MSLRAPVAVLVGACLSLAACAPSPTPIPPLSPEKRPERSAPAPAQPSGPSALSRSLARYYDRVQFGLTSRGLLRNDYAPADRPFTARHLAENFERIALYEEYATVEDRVVAAQTESRLRKWAEPVRLQVAFGDTVSDRIRAQDRAAIESYTERLSRITGHPITTVKRDGNFHVFIVDEDDRRELGPRLRELLPGLSDAAVQTVLTLPRSSYCLAFATDPDDNGTYRHAVAIVRAEHPDLLRLSCLHEEIAQGLGLSNDSPMARPSIFNDDEEFALLTRHDELLLKMLYDPRMEAGMSPAEARPVAREIAAELMPGS